MARKSRRNTGREAAVGEVQTYSAGLYVRLSVLNTGESIQTQTALLEAYAARQADISVYDIYADNGETGTVFERPAFQRLMSDIRAGFVNCVVVKDLSRFGRNYLEAGTYIETVFPALNVRFIAVNEAIDSLDPHPKNPVSMAFRNIANDFYAKDISAKSASAFRAMQIQGEYIGARAPYGYLKSPENKHKLLVDPETAPIIRKIFEWKSEGAGDSSIAKRLNALAVPSPFKLRLFRGEVSSSRYGKCLWQGPVIRYLCTNPAYLGHMAQHKTESILCPGFPTKRLPPEEWIIVENQHEAIVDETIYRRVQNVIEARRRQYEKSRPSAPKSIHILKGKMVCGNCGRHMDRKAASKSKGNYYYICPTYERNGSGFCQKMRICDSVLNEIVNEAIKQLFELAGNMQLSRQELEAKWNSEREKYFLELDRLQRKLEQIDVGRANLYSSYDDGRIDVKVYNLIRGHYSEEEKKLKDRASDLNRLLKENEAEFNGFMELLGYSQKNPRQRLLVTEEAGRLLIQKIVVRQEDEIDIFWNLQDYMSKEAGYNE